MNETNMTIMIPVKLKPISEFEKKEGFYIVKAGNYLGKAWYDELKDSWFYNVCDDPYYMNPLSEQPTAYAKSIQIEYKEYLND